MNALLELLLEAIGWTKFVSTASEIDQGYATIVAAMLAGLLVAIGWIVSTRIEKGNFRNQASYEFLINEPGNEAMREFVRRYVSPWNGRSDAESTRQREDLQYGKVRISEHNGTPAHVLNFRTFLAHYEDLAVSVRLNLVSEKFVYLTEKSVITQSYRMAAPILAEWRRTYFQPTLNENFELLAFRFYFDQPTAEQQVWYWITGGKTFWLSAIHRDALLRYHDICLRNAGEPTARELYERGDWAPLKESFRDYTILWALLRLLLLGLLAYTFL